MEENFIKIISATYKLLDVFPEGDPLKTKAKERVLMIAENVALEDVVALETYLELAKNMGWINSMNFLIIKREWELIRKQISNIQLPISKESPNTEKLKNGERSGDGVRLKRTVVGNYSPRQEKILKILAGKQKAQVQDIIKEMPNVTKRTIRRDLDDLLKKREIARIGEFNQVFYQKSR